MAIGVMSAAWEAGLHIPADLSVVGLDNILQARYVTPPLTTIMIDKAALMSQAIDVLLKEIEGQHTPAIPIIPASLVVRNSTGPPRTKM
jgi:DNA-binding LacI/PurR family transcriptional regulator